MSRTEPVACIGLYLLLCLAAGVGAPFAEDLFDIDLLSLTRLPLWEPTAEEYFPARRGGERDESGLPSPVVLTNPTHEEFVWHARRGYPIRVSDWGRHMKYDGWTGKDFAEAFPFGYMKAEYIESMPGFRRKDHDIKIIDGEFRFNLGNFKPDRQTMWHNFTRPASKRYSDDPAKPISGPYVWHVKDELSPAEKQLVQARFEAPRFMRDPLNKAWMNRSFELWFSPGAGSGAGAHNDGYCESVVSLQFRGDKRWRMMLEPDMTFLSSYDEFDGGVYDAGLWKPDLGFLNRRGGALLWPPGYLHESRTLEPADGECGAAVTLQFAFPQPVQFIRAFLPRLSLSAEVGQCVARSWSGYATLYVPGLKPAPKEQEMTAQLEKIMSVVDSDGDGKVTVEEARAFLETPRLVTVLPEVAPLPEHQREFFFRFKAEDTVAYHDTDDDMVASRQEIWDSLVQWNVVRVRLREGLKLVNAADREGLEAFERSLDYLRRRPAELPARLRPELEQLFSLRTGTRIFKSLKGIQSFSDQEFFSVARDRIEQLLRTSKTREEM